MKESRTSINPYDLKQIFKKLGEAHLLYTAQSFQKAKFKIKEIIQILPSITDAWITLAMIHDVSNDFMKAVNFYLIAAIIRSRDLELWRLLSIKTFKLGMILEAVECFNQNIARNKFNFNLKQEKALMLWEAGYRHQAMTVFELLYTEQQKKGFSDQNLAKHLCRCYYKIKNNIKAAKLLARAVLTINIFKGDDAIINILASIYIEMTFFKDAYKVICRAKSCKSAPNMIKELPIELQIKAHICKMRIGLVTKNMNQTTILDEQNLDEYGDLYIDLSHTYFELKKYHLTIDFLRPLICSSIWDDITVSLKIATCLLKINDIQQSQELYHIILNEQEILTPYSMIPLFEVTYFYISIERLHLVKKICLVNKNSDLLTKVYLNQKNDLVFFFWITNL
jgi:general transcription factor 3C polypeptide 3 (transcription factor C subunit 4)